MFTKTQHKLNLGGNVDKIMPKTCNMHRSDVTVEQEDSRDVGFEYFTKCTHYLKRGKTVIKESRRVQINCRHGSRVYQQIHDNSPFIFCA